MKATFKGAVLSISVLGALGLVAASLVGACSSSSSPASGGNTDAGPGCSAPPGQFPAADCESSANLCNSSGGCPIAARCGSQSTCLPMTSNTPTVQDFRIRRLTIAAPPPLTEANSALVQETVVDHGVNLNAPDCGENGDGSFTWLIHVDRGSNTLKTGGAPPSPDPFGQGYCFVDLVASGGLHLQPVTLPAHFTGSTFSTDPVPKLNIGIFVQGDINNLVILPISNATFQNVTISPDGNCIGSLNYTAMNAQCVDFRQDCSKWKTAGSLGGFITLEEADKVPISILGGKSLCIFLTGAAGSQIAPDGLHCARDTNGKIVLQGDYCSSPAGPGGCQDSYWLAATFAAAAVKINDGSGTPQCQASVSDGGRD